MTRDIIIMIIIIIIIIIIIRRVNEEKNILHIIRKRRTNWIGHILRRNCLRKHVIAGEIEEMICDRKTRKKM